MKKRSMAQLAVLLVLALSSCGIITINRPGQTTDSGGTTGTDITAPTWEPFRQIGHFCRRFRDGRYLQRGIGDIFSGGALP